MPFSSRSQVVFSILRYLACTKKMKIFSEIKFLGSGGVVVGLYEMASILVKEVIYRDMKFGQK